jgi:hypothetical protein
MLSRPFAGRRSFSVILKKIIQRWLSPASSSSATYTWQSPIPLDTVVHESHDDQALKILAAEIADLTKAMRELLMTSDRYVYFGGIIAAAALTLGVLRHDDGKNWMILVFAPYALALTYIYLVQIFTEVERRAGYLMFLEQKAREYARAPILIFSDVNARGARSRASNWGAQALNGCALLSLAVLSANETRRYDAKGPTTFGLHLLNLHYLNVLLLFLTFLTLAMAIVENGRECKRAYRAAGDAHDRYARQLQGAKESA